MENLFKNTFLLDEKTAYIGTISKKFKKIVAKAVIRVLNRLLSNLNNGFHQREKKF